MKSRTLTCITAMTLFAVLATPVGLAAQDGQDHKPKHHHYKVINTGTLGGPSSFLGFEQSRNINNRGVLAASTDTATPKSPPFSFNDCYVEHTTQWRNGVLTDLGTLSGSSSGTTWITDAGSIAGLSQLPVIDPLTGSPELEAVLWSEGEIIALGTLGGNESAAESVNDRLTAMKQRNARAKLAFDIYVHRLQGASAQWPRCWEEWMFSFSPRAWERIRLKCVTRLAAN